MTSGTSGQIRLSDVVGGGYGEIWGCKSRYRVIKGGKGSKKSTTMALNHIVRLMQYPESNLLVVRAYMTTHRDSTFAQLKWAQEKLGVAHLWRNTVSPMQMTYLPTGQKILFRGFDDVLKLASTTVEKGYLCFVWVEEAYEIANEDDFEKLDFSVPRSAVPAPLFNQTTITFNPWSETHWLKKRFFDDKSPLVSAYTTTYKCNEFLAPEYLISMEEERKRNFRKYDVIGLGNWGIAEGLVYENWEIGVPEQKKEWQWKTFFGLDYGYTNDPTAFIVFDVNPIERIIYIKDEIYERKLLNTDIAARIIEKGYAKEIIRADAAEPKSNDDLRRMGIQRIRPSVKGRDSILNGIQKIQDYKIYVSPTCKAAIAELSTYRWEVDGENHPINRAVDHDNHLMDAMRYAFEDVKLFRPADPEKHQPRRRDSEYFNHNDMNGGWG